MRSKDERILGRIDAVSLSADGPVLRDFKSGLVFDLESSGDRTPKTEYVTQLHLYAALYEETSGDWPVRLELVPLGGDPIDIEFGPEVCREVLSSAKRTLRDVNDVIEGTGSQAAKEPALAKPTPSNCAFCCFRPVCRPYRRAVSGASDLSDWPADRWSVVQRIQTLGNGKLLLELEDGLRVRGLSREPLRHPALRSIEEGAGVAAFSLRRTRSPAAFLESEFTTIYKNRPAQVRD